MRIINSNDIAEVVKGMCIKANCHINKDIKSALSNSVKSEKSDISKGVIENRQQRSSYLSGYRYGSVLYRNRQRSFCRG